MTYLTTKQLNDRIGEISELGGVQMLKFHHDQLTEGFNQDSVNEFMSELYDDPDCPEEFSSMIDRQVLTMRAVYYGLLEISFRFKQEIDKTAGEIGEEQLEESPVEIAQDILDAMATTLPIDFYLSYRWYRRRVMGLIHEQGIGFAAYILCPYSL